MRLWRTQIAILVCFTRRKYGFGPEYPGELVSFISGVDSPGAIRLFERRDILACARLRQQRAAQAPPTAFPLSSFSRFPLPIPVLHSVL